MFSKSLTFSKSTILNNLRFSKNLPLSKKFSYFQKISQFQRFSQFQKISHIQKISHFQNISQFQKISHFQKISQFFFSGVQRTPSNRSTASNVSSLLSFEPIPDEDLIDSPSAVLSEDQLGENRLEFHEQVEYKQDKSLSAVKLVCKNAAKVLKRKDSSGSILKEGQVKKSDFA